MGEDIKDFRAGHYIGRGVKRHLHDRIFDLLSSLQPELWYPLFKKSESANGRPSLVGIRIYSNDEIFGRFGELGEMASYHYNKCVGIVRDNNGMLVPVAIKNPHENLDLAGFREIDRNYRSNKEFLESLIMYGGEGGR